MSWVTGVVFTLCWCLPDPKTGLSFGPKHVHQKFAFGGGWFFRLHGSALPGIVATWRMSSDLWQGVF